MAVALPALVGLVVLSVLWTNDRDEVRAVSRDHAARTQLSVGLVELEMALHGTELFAVDRVQSALDEVDDPRFTSVVASMEARFASSLDKHVQSLPSSVRAVDEPAVHELVDRAVALTRGAQVGRVDPTWARTAAREALVSLGGGKLGTEAAMLVTAHVQDLLTDEARLLLSSADPTTTGPRDSGAALDGRRAQLIDYVRSAAPPARVDRLLEALDGPSDAERARAQRQLDAGEATFIEVGASIMTRVLGFEDLRQDIVAYYESNALDELATAERNYWLSVGITTIAALAALGAAAWAGRIITRDLGATRRLATAISRGEIDTAVEIGSHTDPRSREVAAVHGSLVSAARMLSDLRDGSVMIADGVIDAEKLTGWLPGPFGVDVDRTVQRISITTHALRASQALSAALVDAAVDAILAADAEDVVIDVNPAAVRLLGRGEDQLIGRRLGDLVNLRRGLPAGTHVDREDVLDGPDGPVEVTVATRVLDGVGATAERVVFLRDDSERRRLENRLRDAATTDSLTGLANRWALVDGVKALADAGQTAALLYVDLDRFKMVNDSLGHAAGDELLRSVADRLSALAVEAGGRAGRLGGDEFVIVVPDASIESAAELAERVVEALRVRFGIAEQEVFVGVSVGVALMDAGAAVDADEAFRRADLAMYKAKQNGRNRIEVFDDAMGRWAEYRAHVEQDLRSALDSGDQLTTAVQPIVDLPTGHVVGGEVLARWTRPDGTVVPPAVFVGVAEETGLAIELGRWALRCAVDMLAASPGADWYLAVNISGLHVAGGGLAADVDEIVSRAGVPPRRLVIEITESHLLADLDVAARQLRQVRELGCRIAIDDFGTGYSSLTYLRQLPADVLKIDRSFTSSLRQDGGDATVVEMLCEMATRLGLATVAEGIEDAVTGEALADMGCAFGQGYHWARGDSFDAFLAQVSGVAAGAG